MKLPILRNILAFPLLAISLSGKMKAESGSFCQLGCAVTFLVLDSYKLKAGQAQHVMNGEQSAFNID